MHGAAYGDVPEMTMRDYWRVVVRRKWLVVLAVVVTVAGAGAMVAVQKKIYAGEAQMIVRALPSDSVFGSSTNNASNGTVIDTNAVVNISSGTVFGPGQVVDNGGIVIPNGVSSITLTNNISGSGSLSFVST
jgi:capsular polysaccharide biosynthesis protein